MSKKIMIVIVLLSITTIVKAQNEANFWYFGENAGIQFNGSTPTALTNGQLNTVEGCATISDITGQLLFYTDGITVWDKTHSIMPNGIGLLGDSSSTQSAIIVPNPSNSDIYYIFTVDANTGANGLRYSEVDLTLNGGNGDVTNTKNVLLYTPTTEKISAIKKNNGIDFWVVTHAWNNADFLSFSVTAAGVNTTPIISTSGQAHQGISSESIGCLKISPDGNRLALAKSYGGGGFVEVFDFNSTTGIVSTPILIDTLFDSANSTGPYGIEFSPNSNLLYVSEDGDNNENKIYQFNISLTNAADIINSNQILYQDTTSKYSLQLAPNGKIYIASFQNYFLDVIEKPNTIGFGANYVINAVNLNGNRCNAGLPPFIQSFFNVGFQFENLCFGSPTLFTSNITNTYNSILWDFGDGTTSTLENPTHIFSSTGNYNISLSITANGQTTTEIKNLTIYNQPIATQPQNINICDDDSNDGVETFNLNNQDLEILNGQLGTDNTITYHTTITDANAGTNTINSLYDNTTNPQTIYVRLENNSHPECYTTTHFQLIVNELPILLMNNQWSICEGDFVEIFADTGYDSYLWSTGEITSSIVITTPGNYQVTATNLYGLLSCDVTKDITVVASNIATITNIETIDWTQSDNIITVITNGLGDYEYSIDGFTYQDSNQFTNLTISEYTVYVRDKNGCGIASDAIYLLYYPKFFTPNGDGINDYWQITNSNQEPQNEIFIFDRFGKLITELNPESIGWNGMYNKKALPATDYWFLLKRKNGKQYKGHFSLKR